ncbi:aminotransferase class V-fold PLP-dependent enzyme [Salinibacterium sp. GXW1014]|uniref:aminotransferase class V-fold PLP-dependent enzyme n=1 Tax=Salinibacterium sp. GXW1014 TaxID=3377838 RepID=UPI00383A8478
MIRRRTPPVAPLTEYVTDFAEDPGYLDFAYLGPAGEPVIAEERMVAELTSRARFGTLDSAEQHDERMREAVARATGFESDQVVFQPDTSTGIMHTMFGLEGVVALSPAEYPSTLFAVARAQRALGRLQPLWLEPEYGRVTPGTFRELPEEVTAVLVSVVDFRTGYRIDLEGIRQVIGDRLLIVDAVQAFGAVDAPWEVADVIVSGGQKWLRAGRGTGFLVMSDRALERIEPVLSGWIDEPADFLEMSGEGGVPDVPEAPRAAASFAISRPRPTAQARLATALERLDVVGIDEVEAGLHERVDQVLAVVDEFGLPVISPRAADERAGIVVVEPDAAHVTPLAAALHNHAVSATVWRSSIRLSPHVSTSEETLSLLRMALAEFAAGVSA